ncbi:hypothetical protein GEMRC1_008298 [Eukaryota sp. GEM-RC1]
MQGTFANIPIRDIPSRHDLVVLDSNSSILECLSLLIESYYTAPVRNALDNSILGLIDVADIVAFVIDSWHSKHPINLYDKCSITPVQEIVTLNRANPLIPLNENGSLLDAIRVLAHVRRVPVFNETECVRILSQTDIIRFLVKNKSLLPLIGDVPVSQTFSGIPKKILSVKPTDRTITAFEIMNEKKIYSLGVISENGEIVANISLSDIRCILETKSVSFLTEPVLDTIVKVRSHDLKAKTNVFLIRPEHTFFSCVGKVSYFGSSSRVLDLYN